MPVNSTHLDYDGSLPAWLRTHAVLIGEHAVKAGCFMSGGRVADCLGAIGCGWVRLGGLVKYLLPVGGLGRLVGRGMPVNSTHPDYDTNPPAGLRARHVFASEFSVRKIETAAHSGGKDKYAK